MANEININLLREVFSYDPCTGDLLWRKRGDGLFSSKADRRRWNAKYAGKPAGSSLLSRSGRPYFRVGFNGKMYFAHRIAWAMHYGSWPTGEIDHIDGNGQNNRINNLRAVDKALNQRNRALAKNNTSGATGVRFEKSTSKWVANIGIDGTLHHIGCYSSFDDAVAARKKTEYENGFTPRHGEPDEIFAPKKLQPYPVEGGE